MTQLKEGGHTRLLLSPLAMLCFTSLIAAMELVSGTNIYFVAMVTVAIICACMTYNLLGGLGRIAGIAFSGFAIGTLVFSQFGKAVLLEPADRNLRVPDLTITVYAVYFFFLLLGTFVFCRVRLRLPKPVEPTTSVQSRQLYLISLIGGVAGTVGVVATQFGPAGAQETLTHSYFRALAYLLPFSLVLAVDEEIRVSHGQHSINWRALIPAGALLLDGFIGATRQGFVEPFLIVFLTCYLRNYRFRMKHIVAGIALSTVFLVVVSPFYLYARDWRGQPTMSQQFSTMVRVLRSAPTQWAAIVSTVSSAPLGNTRLVNYFQQPWAVTLNRFALIGPDSTLIEACSRNFHYGFTSLKMDFRSQMPRFLDRNKPEFGSEPYLGQLDGQEADAAVTTHSTITAISDSFGSFGFLGVVIFAFFVPPLIFVVYDSVFDMSRPWGTVALVSLLFAFAGGSMGTQIALTMIRQPIYLVVISICTGWILRMIPTVGDHSGVRRSGAFSPRFHTQSGE